MSFQEGGERWNVVGSAVERALALEKVGARLLDERKPPAIEATKTGDQARVVRDEIVVLREAPHDVEGIVSLADGKADRGQMGIGWDERLGPLYWVVGSKTVILA